MCDERLSFDPLATYDHVERAAALYRDHAGHHLPIPDPADLWRSIKEGEMFGVWNAGGDLVAVGGTFEISRCLAEDGCELLVYELAGLVVEPSARSIRPYGVQDVLVALRVAALASSQGATVCVISSVASANGPSRKSLLRCGLREMAPDESPLWLKDARRTWLPGVAPEVVDHVVTFDTLARLETVLAEAEGSEGRRRAADGSDREVEIAIPQAGPARNALAEVVRGAVWRSVVPAQRLIGNKRPFHLWSRR